MKKFYLNNYVWLELVFSLIISGLLFLTLFLNKDLSQNNQIIKNIISINSSLFGALVSLLGFVFATLTILVGLGDNFKGNENTSILLKIIERTTKTDDLELDEIKQIKNKHTSSSLFFSTNAYSLTLKCLLSSVIILACSSFLSLIVSILGSENILWAIFIIFFLSYVLLSIIRILFIITYIIQILTNKEKSDK